MQKMLAVAFWKRYLATFPPFYECVPAILSESVKLSGEYEDGCVLPQLIFSHDPLSFLVLSK
jgi:hypothetical protein